MLIAAVLGNLGKLGKLCKHTRPNEDFTVIKGGQEKQKHQCLYLYVGLLLVKECRFLNMTKHFKH